MLGFLPAVVPPKLNRQEPWEHDKEFHRMRNDTEYLFRIIQNFRRVLCRFDKLDGVYIAFIEVGLICLGFVVGVL